MWNTLPAGITRLSVGTNTATTSSATNTPLQLRALRKPLVGTAAGAGSTALM